MGISGKLIIKVPVGTVSSKMQKLRNLRNRWANFSELSNLDWRNRDECDAIYQKL